MGSDSDASNDNKRAAGLPIMDLPPGDTVDDLKWRGDPQETYSDWIIKIEVNHGSVAGNNKDENSELEGTAVGTSPVQTYHVHRAYLGCGSRKSEYFSKLFESGDTFEEGSSGTSHITLHARAAAAFPKMLDFVYGSHNVLKVNPFKESSLEDLAKDSVALYRLGDYFGIESLKHEVTRFLQSEITAGTAHHAYPVAQELRSEAIGQILVNIVARDIFEIRPKSQIMAITPLPFWLKVLTCAEVPERGSSFSARVSDLVLEAFHAAGGVSKTTLRAFTHKGVMPKVSAASALAFYEFSERIDPTHPNTACLFERCAEGLAGGYLQEWHTIQNDSDGGGEYLKRLKQCKPEFLAAVLTKTWAKAEEQQRLGQLVVPPELFNI